MTKVLNNIKKKQSNLLVIVALLVSSTYAHAQTIGGNLKLNAGQTITLSGFNYYKTIKLGESKIDSLGFFSINYPKGYNGMAILKAEDQSSLVCMLTQPTIKLKGEHLTNVKSLNYTNSLENRQFLHYAQAQGVRSNALAAINYLIPLYQKQKTATATTQFIKTLAQEKERLIVQDTRYVNGLAKNSYIRWFIPLRKLVQETPTIAKTAPKRIPEIINFFRTINFNNKNFKNSGLLKNLINDHYMLLENMGQPLDSVFTQMNISTQYLITNLQNNEEVLNEVSNNLFNYLEARSLFKASAYLSVTLLNNNQCTLTSNLAAKLESYRKLKVGAIAPDITLQHNTKLSNLKTTKLLVFGASWCPNCKKDLLELKKYNNLWKAKNVEIVYISIDTNKNEFEKAYKNVPWQTYCNYKGWETQAAKDYYISGTPSYFLLDKNQKILVRPNSVAHANAWIKQKIN